MTTLQAIVLGCIQGLTEFLPISSSGHLLVAEYFLNLQIAPEHMLGFEILLHTGTLLALLCCYPQQWWKIVSSLWNGDKKHQRLLGLLILATIPGAAAGLFLGDLIEAQTRGEWWLIGGFIVTAIILWISERKTAKGDMLHIRPWHAVIIGIAQAFALPPSLSRSGLTYGAGQWLGLSQKEALDFSFLMLVPILCGATLITVLDIREGTAVLPAVPVIAAGIASAFVSSIAAILLLRSWVSRFSFRWFSLYLVALSFALFLRL